MKGQSLLAMMGAALLPLSIGAFPAQTDDNLLDLSLEELMKIKVTSSTLTDETLRTVPSSITVFTRAQIQAMGIDYLHELINFVPGFQSFRQDESGDEYYHSSRGHRSSTTSREVLIVVDGQRFNRGIDNAIAAPMLALGNIQRIEFIRGPGSAVYGSNAFLGVINIFTTTGQNAVTVNTGTNNNHQGQIQASKTMGEAKLDVYANAFDDNGEKYTLETPSTHTPYSARDPRSGQDVNLKLQWHEAHLNLLHFERDSNEFYVLGYLSNEKNHTENNFTSMLLENTQGWTSQFSTTYSGRFFQEQYRAVMVNPALGLANVDQTASGMEIKINNLLQLNTDKNMRFGVEYRKIELDESILNTANIGKDILYNQHTREVTGVYMQYQQPLFTDGKLTLGLRGDDYTNIKTAVSPRFGFTYQLTDVQSLKLLYGEAFRAPTTNELALRNVFSAAGLVGNSQLDPETIATWELVWMGNWQCQSLALTAFSSVIHDEIVRDNTLSPATFINAKEDDKTHGAELEYAADITPAWSARMNYSWMGSLSDSDFRQANELASYILNFQQQPWNFNIAVQQVGEREQLSGSKQITLDSYWQLNSKLQYTVRKTQSYFVQIKNATDEEYLTPAVRSSFNTGLPNRGREISVGLHWVMN